MALASSSSEAHLSPPCAGPTRGPGLRGAHSGHAAGRHRGRVLQQHSAQAGQQAAGVQGMKAQGLVVLRRLQKKLTNPLGFERVGAERFDSLERQDSGLREGCVRSHKRWSVQGTLWLGVGKAPAGLRQHRRAAPAWSEGRWHCDLGSRPGGQALLTLCRRDPWKGAAPTAPCRHWRAPALRRALCWEDTEESD